MRCAGGRREEAATKNDGHIVGDGMMSGET
jgi:hypothetical protein